MTTNEEISLYTSRLYNIECMILEYRDGRPDANFPTTRTDLRNRWNEERAVLAEKTIDRILKELYNYEYINKET